MPLGTEGKIMEGAPMPGSTPNNEKEKFEEEGQEKRDQAETEKQKEMMNDLKTIIGGREGKSDEQLRKEVESSSLAVYFQNEDMKEKLMEVISGKDENGEYAYTVASIEDAITGKKLEEIKDATLKELAKHVASPEAKGGENA